MLYTVGSSYLPQAGLYKCKKATVAPMFKGDKYFQAIGEKSKTPEGKQWLYNRAVQILDENSEQKQETGILYLEAIMSRPSREFIGADNINLLHKSGSKLVSAYSGKHIKGDPHTADYLIKSAVTASRLANKLARVGDRDSKNNGLIYNYAELAKQEAYKDFAEICALSQKLPPKEVRYNRTGIYKPIESGIEIKGHLQTPKPLNTSILSKYNEELNYQLYSDSEAEKSRPSIFNYIFRKKEKNPGNENNSSFRINSNSPDTVPYKKQS